MDDFWELFEKEDPEKQMRRYQMEKIERERKTKEAVKEVNFSIREYSKIEEGGKSKQKFTLFCNTEKGIEGYPDTIGKIDFTLYENISLSDVFIAGKKKEGHLDKLLHFDLVIVYSNYRKHGISEKLIEEFVRIYEEVYREFPISIEFMTPVAEYQFKKILAREERTPILDEKYTLRYYKVNEQVNHLKLIEELQKKDVSIFPLSAKSYIDSM